MNAPEFTTPVAAMSDVRLCDGMWDVRNFFDTRAREDAAEGDIFGGWDWPTMRVVHPELCARYDAMRDQAIGRLNATGGQFAGHQWTKTETGWKPEEVTWPRTS